MKNLSILFVLLCFLGIISINAQAQVVTLEHNGVTSVFYGSYSFNDAYNASANGDTLILSSNNFNTYLYIQKSLKIFGAYC